MPPTPLSPRVRPRRSIGSSGRDGRGAGRFAAQAAGELLLTAGAVLVLFVVWQLWWTNLGAAETQRQAVTDMSRSFVGPSRPVDNEVDYGDPPTNTHDPEYGDSIGVLYIPRFGSDYSRPIVHGTGTDVLDSLGLGHYEDTAMPGEVGNFAMAGHRQTNGKVLDLIHTLELGDRIHVRTADGYYTYTMTDRRIVAPTDTAVVAPDPWNPGSSPTQRVLTLTSCHPRYGDTERYIVHARLTGWRPSEAGPPAEISSAVVADTEE